MENQQMERGTDALKAHLGSTTTSMDIRQTRRGWMMELLCPCEAKVEFKYFVSDQQVASSLEESNWITRWCCKGCHPWNIKVTEMNTEAELLNVERPCTFPIHSCKCCCYQQANVSSGGQDLGSIKENCFCLIPKFKVIDDAGNDVYKVHAPTCCCGVCVNCCAEGNPCGKGCCRASFRVFPAEQANTNGDAPYVGVILKKPKSMMTEIFTEANAFDVKFPDSADAEKKALLVGSALFLNSLFYERSGDE